MPAAIRYARTADGAELAFASVGDGPLLVCMPPTPFSHLEAGWRLRGRRAFYSRLARRARVLLYDARATGMSSGAPDFSIDAQQRDLDAVVRRDSGERFTLCAFFNAVPVAIAFAAAHPTTVEGLVVMGGFARGTDVYPLPFASTPSAVLETHWGMLTDTAARMWTAGSGDEADETASYFRECAAPAVALAAFMAAREYDVTPLLPAVRAPTLVLHRRDSRAQRLELARELASHIPNAELVLLPGEAASPFSGDVEALATTIERFLGLAPAGPAGAHDAAAPADARDAQPLTQREEQVLRLLARGQTNKEIALALRLSVHTVERHVTNLYAKIGARSRSEATAYALRHGLE